jgi:hypothetical protein
MLFKRAATAVKDHPQAVFDEWVEFERCHGTLSELDDARRRRAAKEMQVWRATKLEEGRQAASTCDAEEEEEKRTASSSSSSSPPSASSSSSRHQYERRVRPIQLDVIKHEI